VIYPVVLAGGAGTRFWPASRRARPKPFVSLVGGTPLIESTLERLEHLAAPEQIAVVTAAELEGVTRAALRDHPGITVLAEPDARNTGAAIAWAAAWVAGRDPAGLLGIFPADHHIPQVAAFVRSVTAAGRAAADGDHLVLIGIEPTRPDTAYGYLKLAGRGRGAQRVARFVEKPNSATARRYLAHGGYLWNAGMVVARPARVLEETRAHAPEIWDALGAELEKIAAGQQVSGRALARGYRAVKPISFDYAVLERSDRVRAVRGRFRWSDLGSWDALGEHLPRAGTNRALHAERLIALDSGGNVVWTQSGKQVVLLGLDDVIVAETDDALLICGKHRAQDVRRAVDELKRRGREELT
jgi:mannose-1-phosphate guanylyltransferase